MRSLLLGLALTASLVGCAKKSAEVKVYAVVVLGSTPMLMYTAVYRADAGKQTVDWWVEGVGGEMALENCAVRDGYNWRCEKKDSPGTGSVMTDGRYTLFGAVEPEGWKFLTEREWKAIAPKQ